MGKRNILGAILELAHHLLLQNEWNIKIIFHNKNTKN